jgi:hypothetical protein
MDHQNCLNGKVTHTYLKIRCRGARNRKYLLHKLKQLVCLPSRSTGLRRRKVITAVSDTAAEISVVGRNC